MSILDKIVIDKRLEVEKLKKEVPVETFAENRGFSKKSFLSEDTKKLEIIAEIKRASPSKGDIAPGLDSGKRALEYEKGGAAAVSVLTDEKYFKGSLKDLLLVKEKISIPVLRKDFIIDEYQIYESAFYRADSILLIARILSEKELAKFYEKAVLFGIKPLVEVFSDEDLIKIKSLKSALIGVNNRNLSSFETSLDNCLKMAEKIHNSNTIIGLSGILSADDASYLYERGINKFLIGEYLSSAENPGEKIMEIMDNAETR